MEVPRLTSDDQTKYTAADYLTAVDEYCSARDELHAIIIASHISDRTASDLAMSAVESNDFEATLMDSAGRIKDVLAGGADPCSRVLDIVVAIKLFRTISNHYRVPIEKFNRRVEEAEKKIARINSLFDMVKRIVAEGVSNEDADEMSSQDLARKLIATRSRFIELTLTQMLRDMPYSVGDEVRAIDPSLMPNDMPTPLVIEDIIDGEECCVRIKDDPLPSRLWIPLYFRPLSNTDTPITAEILAARSLPPARVSTVTEDAGPKLLSPPDQPTT